MATRWFVPLGLVLLCAGCSSTPPVSPPTPPPSKDAAAQPAHPKNGTKARANVEPEDPVFDKGDTPEEGRYVEAGKPFIVAVAGNDPAAAYACLAQQARAQMNLLQFKTPQSETEQAELAKQVFKEVSAEKFAELFKEVVSAYGSPKAVKRLYCFNTDPQVLAGKGELLDSMFAIGGMPDTIPASVRRASLRGQVCSDWKPGELARLAKEYGMTQEELLQDEESQPYFNLKFVLIEENGELKVGYFEFMPPSIMD